MSAVLAEFCRSIHRLYWLLISSLGYSVLTIGLICIVLGLTLPVYLLRDIIRNSLGVRLRWLNWLSILLIGLRLLRSLLVLYRLLCVYFSSGGISPSLGAALNSLTCLTCLTSGLRLTLEFSSIYTSTNQLPGFREHDNFHTTSLFYHTTCDLLI